MQVRWGFMLVGWFDFEQLVLIAGFTRIRVHLVSEAPAALGELMVSFPVFAAHAGGLGVHGLSSYAALSVSESSSDSARHRK